MKNSKFLLVVLLFSAFAFLAVACSSKPDPISPNGEPQDTLQSSSPISSLSNNSASIDTIVGGDTIPSSPQNNSSVFPSSQNVSSAPVSSQPQSVITIELTADTNRVVAGNAINFSYTINSTDAIVSVRVDFDGNQTIDTTLFNAQSGNFSRVFDAVGSLYTVIIARNSQGASSRDSLRVNIIPFIPDTGVVDTTTPPIITITPPLNDTINLGETWAEPGFSATDNIGNNITSFVVRTIYDAARNPRPISFLTHNAGIYTVEYSVEDFFGNVAETRIRTVVVIVVDVTPPVIDLAGSVNMTVTRGQPYIEPGFSAFDDHDNSAEIAANVAVTVRNSAGTVVNINTFTSTVGVYTIHYSVADRAGNQAVTVIRTVTVASGVANARPTITILGPNPVLIPLRGTYTEHGATAADAEDGILTPAIAIDVSNINTFAPGLYSTVYSVTDGDGATTTAERSVRVIGEDGSSFVNSYILTPGTQRSVPNRTNNHFTFVTTSPGTFLFTASGFTFNFIGLTVFDHNFNVISPISDNQTGDGRSVQFTTTTQGQFYIMIHDEYENMNTTNITTILTVQ